MNICLENIFSFQDKVNVLKKRGYEVRKETYQTFQSVYHNAMEEITQEVYNVYHNDKLVIDPTASWHHYTGTDVVDVVFRKILRVKLTKFLGQL